ncbi:hypothetical protein VPNG_00415 [Cytospora leucostoma]|uniref:Uncharacterized protein n=1 Tax=Cytospora leucostoma TaxID=1230097 RepID=A0A423XNT3_9PEZI|nr:hypothetical protein VPNG_00415 [Cytospora leucostoma]
MGALCGKESKSDSFAGTGRRLDSAPPERQTAPLPSNKRVVGGPPRTLGGGPGGPGEEGASSSGAADARRRAAEAAEARAKAAEGRATGKLGSQLQQQKKQTMNETLRKDAEEEARRKEIFVNAETAKQTYQ